MAVIEARMPDGKLAEVTEVNLSKSGLLILITDHDGHQVFVHRYAWEGVVAAVKELYAEEERQAQAWLATAEHRDDDD